MVYCAFSIIHLNYCENCTNMSPVSPVFHTVVTYTLHNGGIFSGLQSLLALYLGGTPSQMTGTSPLAAYTSTYISMHWSGTFYLYVGQGTHIPKTTFQQLSV